MSVHAHMQQYQKQRSDAISALKILGPHPYPHKFDVSMSLPAFVERYQNLENGECYADIISVAGK